MCHHQFRPLYMKVNQFVSKLKCQRGDQMEEKKKNANNSGNWIAVGVALGAVIFALTKEPVWIAVGVAIGAAIDWTYRKK